MADQPARPLEEDRKPAFHGAAHGAGAGGSILLPDMPLPERRPGQPGGGMAPLSRPDVQQSNKR